MLEAVGDGADDNTSGGLEFWGGRGEGVLGATEWLQTGQYHVIRRLRDRKRKFLV